MGRHKNLYLTIGAYVTIPPPNILKRPGACGTCAKRQILRHHAPAMRDFRISDNWHRRPSTQPPLSGIPSRNSRARILAAAAPPPLKENTVCSKPIRQKLDSNTTSFVQPRCLVWTNPLFRDGRTVGEVPTPARCFLALSRARKLC